MPIADDLEVVASYSFPCEADRARSTALEAQAESRLPPAPEEVCPRCGASARAESRERVRPRLRDLALALAAPVRRSRTRYACPGGGHRWSGAQD